MFRKYWVAYRNFILAGCIPALWILYAVLAQQLYPIPHRTFWWVVTRWHMLGLAFVFAYLSFKLLNKATE